MTQNNWKNNNHQGRFVARSLRRMETDFANLQTAEERLEMLRGYVYIWNIMAQVGKNVEIEELKDDMDELKRLVGLAQSTKISK